MTETKQKSLIIQRKYDLTLSERTLIERGLLLADSFKRKEYTYPIIGAEFVLIPAGTFMMGSPTDERWRNDDETLHQVTISKPFYMQTTPVTRRQWKNVMGGNIQPSPYFGDDELPVGMVSWNDVQDFIKRLNQQEGTNEYRLPTEAEWEYACRAGSTTAYCFGDDHNLLGKYAWCQENCVDISPVGLKKPNAWGLHDMHGNVFEWCQDWYGDYPSGVVTDPIGPSEGTHHVYRGGFYGWGPFFLRSAYRCNNMVDGSSIFLGFRLISKSSHRKINSEVVIEKEVNAEEFKKLQKLGDEKGFMTYKDVNNLFHFDVTSADQADDIVKLFIKIRGISWGGDYVVYTNGTVLATRTNLMWAATDNGEEISWADAKSYCENYRGGGYKDWRMPTLDELEMFFCGNSKIGNYENVFQLSGWNYWTSEKENSGKTFAKNVDDGHRVLPVRSVK